MKIEEKQEGYYEGYLAGLVRADEILTALWEEKKKKWDSFDAEKDLRNRLRRINEDRRKKRFNVENF